ncbi:hypothetical protein GX563_09555 [Candidatus Bathyarchaeota archaeon]|nr:hypothetical protein [Candidatus Bathyarchaeota archaeon]
MAQPIYSCPFCNHPPWRTRYMLWKHIHECLRMQREYIPDVTPPIAGLDGEMAIPA